MNNPGRPNLNNNLDSSVPSPGAEATPSPHPLPLHWSYEAKVAEVERIIERIERGELELAEVVDQFATAVQHLRECESFLTHQQQQVDLLIETLMDEPEPF